MRRERRPWLLRLAHDREAGFADQETLRARGQESRHHLGGIGLGHPRALDARRPEDRIHARAFGRRRAGAEPAHRQRRRNRPVFAADLPGHASEASALDRRLRRAGAAAFDRLLDCPREDHHRAASGGAEGAQRALRRRGVSARAAESRRRGQADRRDRRDRRADRRRRARRQHRQALDQRRIPQGVDGPRARDGAPHRHEGPRAGRAIVREQLQAGTHRVVKVLAARLALLALVLAAWQLLPSRGLVNPLLLPPLGDVLQMLGELVQRAQVREALAVSAAEVLVAFLIAVPLGAALGVLIAENDYLGQVFKPALFVIFAIPKSIFLPLFILVLGVSFQQKVAYAAFTTTFVVLMSAAAAVESVKRDYLLVARSYGATQLQLVTRVYVPSMLPLLLETLRISMIFNFTGVLIAEMYASRTGIGHLIASWGENFQMKQLFAGVILLAAAAILFNETLRWMEHRVSTWRA